MTGFKWQVEREGPKGEGGGEDVGVGKRGLCEPDRVDRRKERYGDCGGGVEQMLREAEDGEQGSGCEGADKESRREDMEASEVPERAEQDVRQRRMGVGEVRNELAGMEEVERGGDVVAALIPEVRQAQKCEVREGYGGKEQREE